jgi:PII-like signaling protein
VAGTPIAEDVDGWRNLAVYHTEDSLHWRPFQSRLLTALRHAGAAGATVVRGRLAYVFDDPLRPRNGWFARSAAPVMIRVVDTRDRVARWFEMVDELTGDGGLVTCEPVRILGRG